MKIKQFRREGEKTETKLHPHKVNIFVKLCDKYNIPKMYKSKIILTAALYIKQIPDVTPNCEKPTTN